VLNVEVEIEAFGDYAPEIIDAIHMDFGLCCGPSSQRIIVSPDSRIGYFATDRVMSCVGADVGRIVTSTSRPHCASHSLTFPRACAIPLYDADVGCRIITNDSYPHRTSHMLTSPRACEILSCEITISHYGSGDVRDEIGDDLPIAIDTITEASNEDDSDDAYLGLVHVHPSPVIDEVSVDGRDVYVEVLSTFPCVPSFTSLMALCAQGLAGLGITNAENLSLLRMASPRRQRPEGDPPQTSAAKGAAKIAAKIVAFKAKAQQQTNALMKARPRDASTSSRTGAPAP
jgi:hypothetical protein